MAVLETLPKWNWQSVQEAFLNLAFPPLCLLCRQSFSLGPDQAMYCQRCREQVITPVLASCYRCATRLPFRFEGRQRVSLVSQDATRSGCPDCRKQRWAFARAVAVGAYESKWRDHIYQLKRMHHASDAFHAGRLLGRQIASTDWYHAFDALVPLPCHWRRRLTRGFNQAEEIARGAATVLHWPVLTGVLHCDRYTRKQGTLSGSERLENVKGAFRLSDKRNRIQGRSIFVIDDVMTTGATVNQAAQMCRKAGAAEVAVGVVARTGLN